MTNLERLEWQKQREAIQRGIITRYPELTDIFQELNQGDHAVMSSIVSSYREIITNLHRLAEQALLVDAENMETAPMPRRLCDLSKRAKGI